MNKKSCSIKEYGQRSRYALILSFAIDKIGIILSLFPFPFIFRRSGNGVEWYLRSNASDIRNPQPYNKINIATSLAANHGFCGVIFTFS